MRIWKKYLTFNFTQKLFSLNNNPDDSNFIQTSNLTSVALWDATENEYRNDHDYLYGDRTVYFWFHYTLPKVQYDVSYFITLRG